MQSAVAIEGGGRGGGVGATSNAAASGRTRVSGGGSLKLLYRTASALGSASMQAGGVHC